MTNISFEDVALKIGRIISDYDGELSVYLMKDEDGYHYSCETYHFLLSKLDGTITFTCPKQSINTISFDRNNSIESFLCEVNKIIYELTIGRVNLRNDTIKFVENLIENQIEFNIKSMSGIEMKERYMSMYDHIPNGLTKHHIWSQIVKFVKDIN